MPAFTGPVTIISVGVSAIIEFGDTVFISPKFATKSNEGSGSSNAGTQIIVNSGISSTAAAQSALNDQPIVRDN
ncbi:spore germination protein [Neobacillus pocheonensis]|uniref:Spore germination protein n=1 Tax=Neobacillus pocheonensis TaxID=363869 RepID=A0ABT0WEI9_9BACI|nr:spore germination protein [Neobacillus pocheonensis]